MSSLLLVLLARAACPAAIAEPGRPGLEAVAQPPSAEAMRLNGEGKQLYRQERWSEAREKYRAALVADPELLGARLNIACSFSREGRFGEAVAEASKLLRRAFVPWSREVSEAADLGILQDQPGYAALLAARKEAALAWGQRLEKAVFFVARTKPPLNLPAEGVLVLGLNQEIYAWVPETGRYFQTTAEDGRVLAFVLSADGRRIAFLLAGKLARAPGQADVLRGLSLRVLELPTMTLTVPVPLPGDVTQVDLAFPSQPLLRLADETGAVSGWVLAPGGLERTASAPFTGGVSLTARGVAPSRRRVRRERCDFALAMRQEPAGRWRIEVAPAKGKPFLLDTRYGAGLAGLPFPAHRASSTTAQSKK